MPTPMLGIIAARLTNRPTWVPILPAWLGNTATAQQARRLLVDLSLPAGVVCAQQAQQLDIAYEVAVPQNFEPRSPARRLALEGARFQHQVDTRHPNGVDAFFELVAHAVVMPTCDQRMLNQKYSLVAQGRPIGVLDYNDLGCANRAITRNELFDERLKYL